VHDGSATAGADYVAVSGSLTFDSFANRQTITIPILDDMLVEPDETLFLTLTNATGGPNIGPQGNATLTILDDDSARPETQISAGGPYTISEGDSLPLSAVVTGGDASDFSWDLNGDGVYGDATGPNPTVTWAQLQALGISDGPSVFALRVSAMDPLGNIVASDPSALSVNNTAPTLILSGPASVAAGTPYKLSLSATDPGNDAISNWSIHWGDGKTDVLLGNPTSAQHAYAQGGRTYTISAEATDEDGSFNANQLTLTVQDTAISLTAHGASLASFERSPFQETVATFTDSAASAQQGDFTASVTWGDGTSSSGQITATGAGTFAVTASHTYLDEGRFTVQISIRDQLGNSALATSGMVTLEELLPDGSRGTPDQRYISELYRDLLRRQVDATGLAFWNGLLVNGLSHTQIALGIMTATSEYHTGVVEDMYEHYLHRAADLNGLQDAVDYLKGGGSQEGLSLRFVGSPEYYQTRAQSKNDSFLDALFGDALNRTIDASAKKSFADQLSAGASRGGVADLIFASEEYQVEVVRRIYLRYLDRELEPKGLAIWTALEKSGVTDDALLSLILGETDNNEFYNKTAP
jgi:hypothetical protein